MKYVILMVDDDKTVLDSLLYQLKDHFGFDYQYESALSADEAQEIIDELYQDGNAVKLIITDWLMPETKGDTFLININKTYPDIKLLMLSGYADDESVEQARQMVPLGGYLRKPWEEQELIGKVKELLEQ